MNYIVDPVYLGELSSLKAKVSHSWLDHEIAMVDVRVALSRWRSGKWPLIAARWEPLHSRALEFADMLTGYSASALVDRLPPLQAMAPALKQELKSRLDAIHATLVDTALARREYLARLQALWNCAQRFFVLAGDSASPETDVAAAWERVREAGASLKAAFTTGLIPKGVVLP